MRFLLINPFCPITEGPTPPLGVSFLAAVLEQEGVEVRVLDLSVFPHTKNTIADTLNTFQPDIVGATSVTMTFDHAIAVISEVKSLNPGILTVMGGPHVSFCAKNTLDAFPELDLIAIGEGEATIVEIVREQEGKKRWELVKGLAFRKGGEVIINEARPLIDINTLPLPARHLIPLGRYRALHTAISMTTSRGCPFRCIFCIGRQMVGAKVRYRDPIKVVDELEMLAGYDFPQINISDDLFTAKKDHCFSICDEIIKRKLSFHWSSFARVDTVDYDVLEKMKEAGCKHVSFGVESANEAILKTIKKGITLEKVRKAVQMCIDVGIGPHVSFILGLPGETPETIKETTEFGKELGQRGALYGFHLLAPFPGTAVREENDKYDLKILTDDWREYHANSAIVETSGVSKEMLNDFIGKWDSDTHTALRSIRERMEKGSATEDEAWQVINLDRFLFIYQLMMDELIEKNGSWINGERPVTDDQAVAELSQKIHGFAEVPLEKSKSVIDYAFKRGSIHYMNVDNRIQWRWQNYLSC